MKADPSVAKGLALEFFDKSGQRITQPTIARTVKAVKDLMENGFTEEEIRYGMEEAFSFNPHIYSFAYIESAIPSILKRREEELAKQENKQIVAELAITQHTPVTTESEVMQQDETSERNRRKAERLASQPGLREKSYFHLFEGERETH